MSRGFLKDVNGIKRMRMVKAGKDANNLLLPYNDIVFDSVSPNTMTPYQMGVVRVHNAGSNIKIVSWADLGYIPMTFATAKNPNGDWWWNTVPWTSNNPVLTVGNDGLYLITGSFNLPVDIQYIAFRVVG